MAIDCRLLPRQLRFAKLANVDEATDGQSHGHLRHQPGADYGRRSKLGKSRPVGLRDGIQPDSLPAVGNGVRPLGGGPL